MVPAVAELPESLQKILNPQNPKMLMAVANGLAPLPPQTLVEAWVCLIKGTDPALATAAQKTLISFPEKNLMAVIQGALAGWTLGLLAEIFLSSETILEAILLNQETPDDAFVLAAKSSTEKITQLIANNQERIIQAPQIVPALESNPKNLKSNTDRLRHFLGLAGIFIPGDKTPEADDDSLKGLDFSKLEADGSEEKPEDQKDAAVDALLKANSRLDDSQRQSLATYISKMNVGGKIKLALKGNKEARQILIRDVNAIVAVSVLKSPRITDNEVAAYARLRNVCDDVIRYMASFPMFTKHYDIKFCLSLHPKTPIQQAMGFIKFLTLKDLQKVSKDRGVPTPVKKAAKQLLEQRRK